MPHKKIFHGGHSRHEVFPFLHVLTSAEILLTKPLGPKEIRFLMLSGTKIKTPTFDSPEKRPFLHTSEQLYESRAWKTYLLSHKLISEIKVLSIDFSTVLQVICSFTKFLVHGAEVERQVAANRVERMNRWKDFTEYTGYFSAIAVSFATIERII